MYMLNPYICYSTSSVVSVMRGISTLENGRRKSLEIKKNSGNKYNYKIIVITNCTVFSF